MKIAILGYVGSGKTYISNYISDKEKIPVLHLDAVKFDKEWKPIDDSLVLPIVAEFMAKDDWIIDGYYKTLLLEERLEKTDSVNGFVKYPYITRCYIGKVDLESPTVVV